MKVRFIPEENTEETERFIRDIIPNIMVEKESFINSINKVSNRTREHIYETLNKERDYQDSIWGPDHDKTHEVEAFVLYMEEYLNKSRKNLSGKGGVEKALDNLRKVVALGIACFESHGIIGRR